MLQKDQLVVHSTFGIGQVRRIEEQQILGQSVKLCSLEFVDEDGSAFELKLNSNKLDRSPVRPLIESQEVPAVFQRLKEAELEWSSNANQRRRTCEELLKSGNIFYQCDLIAGLRQLSEHKPLTPREQGLLDRAVTVLVEELSWVTRAEKEDLTAQVLAA